MTSHWYGRFVEAWREDRLTPFGPLNRWDALALEAYWQLHCAQMFDLDRQLERFSRNVTGILDFTGDVESDQRRDTDAQA